MRICNTIRSDWSPRLRVLSRRHNIVNLLIFLKYLHGDFAADLSSLVHRLSGFKRSNKLARVEC